MSVTNNEQLNKPNWKAIDQISSTFCVSAICPIVIHLFLMFLLIQKKWLVCLMWPHERPLMVEFCSYTGCSLTGGSRKQLHQHSTNVKWWSKICRVPRSILAFHLQQTVQYFVMFCISAALPFTSSSSTVVLLLSDDSWRSETDSQFGFKRNSTHICAEYTRRHTSQKG